MKWAFAGRFDTVTERYLTVAGLNAVEHRTYLGEGVGMLVLEPT